MGVRDHVVRRLRDPMWQAIAVFVSLVALLIGTWVTYDVADRSREQAGLQILRVRTEVPSLGDEHKDVDIRLSINGEPAKAVRIDSYIVRNSGDVAIKPQDFTTPLSVKVRAPLQILAVGQSERRHERLLTPLQVAWQRVSPQEFKLQPLLLNRVDSFDVTVFIGADNKLQFLDYKHASPEWSGRIVNIPELAIGEWDEESRSVLREGLFETFIYYQGLEVYLLVVLGALLFALGFKIGRARLRSAGATTFAAATALAALSFCFAVVIIEVLRGRPQPLAAAGISFAYGGLITWFAWTQRRQRTTKKRASKGKQVAASAAVTSAN